MVGHAVSSQSEERANAIADLLLANRILGRKGILDAFGHASIRDPDDPNLFIMARSHLAAALVTENDLVVYDFDANALTKPDVHSHSERFIHAEIYRARPQVGAVVHSHSPNVVPFGVVDGIPLRPVYHMAGFLAAGAPIFEIRETAGNGTNMLVDCPKRGRALVAALGDKPIVLMRGHGNTVVASNIRQASFRAIYTETAAQLQLQAMLIAGGRPVNYITPEEGEAISGRSTGGGTNRAWALWVADLGSQP